MQCVNEMYDYSDHNRIVGEELNMRITRWYLNGIISRLYDIIISLNAQFNPLSLDSLPWTWCRRTLPGGRRSASLDAAGTHSKRSRNKTETQVQYGQYIKL